MKIVDVIENEVKERFGSWTEFSFEVKKDKKNIKRHFIRNIEKLNQLLEPLGLELSVKEKIHQKSPEDFRH